MEEEPDEAVDSSSTTLPSASSMESTTSTSRKVAILDGPLDETTQTDILAALGHKQRHDEQVLNFQRRLQRSPDQCLRYCQFENAAALWASSKGQPLLDAKIGANNYNLSTDTTSADVTNQQNAGNLIEGKDNRKQNCLPICRCGTKRLFEFQVLPQLLYFMEVESRGFMDFDWDTIAVFTCPKSCQYTKHDNGGDKMPFSVEEAWVQTMIKPS